MAATPEDRSILATTAWVQPNSAPSTAGAGLKPLHGVRANEVTVKGQHAEEWPQLLSLAQGVSAWRLFYCVTFKRVLDLILGSLLLIAFSPVMLAIALLIRRETKRPALFKQARVGRNGEIFIVYKFATMIPDRRQRERRKYSRQGTEERRLSHKTKHDPRVTRIGRFLRKTSLDELPQLINVVKGDMSLVGPRPELPSIVERHYKPWQHRRHVVRPGMTGWWQIHGRSDRPMHENTELDIFYVSNQSFGLDLKILLVTIRVVVSRHGAF